MIRLPVIQKFIKRQFSKDISSNVSTSKRQFFEPHYQISVRTAYGDTMTGKFNIGIGFRLDFASVNFTTNLELGLKKLHYATVKFTVEFLVKFFVVKLVENLPNNFSQLSSDSN